MWITRPNMYIQEALFMKKPEINISDQPEKALNPDFITFFQEQILALLKERNLLTETQYRRGLILLREGLS